MKVKCLIFCLLSATLLAGFSVSSKAAEEEALMEEVSALRAEEEYGVHGLCFHSWKVIDEYTIPGAGQYNNTEKCQRRVRQTSKCVKCSVTATKVFLDRSRAHNHNNIWRAECDGVQQTHYKKCGSCFYNNGTVSYERCPRAPHVGPCSFLPAIW